MTHVALQRDTPLAYSFVQMTGVYEMWTSDKADADCVAADACSAVESGLGAKAYIPEPIERIVRCGTLGHSYETVQGVCSVAVVGYVSRGGRAAYRGLHSGLRKVPL